MLFGQWATNDRHVVAVRANVNGRAVHSIFAYNMQTLIGHNTIAAASIKAAPAKCSLLKRSFRSRTQLVVIVEFQGALRRFILLFPFSWDSIGCRRLLGPKLWKRVLCRLIIENLKSCWKLS